MDALAFHLKLNSDTIKLPDVERFIGKDVVITISELGVVSHPKAKAWKHLGGVNLDGKFDFINIRDLA